MSLLKRLFWVYFLLLIFEGALRKWVLPQLSAPLLLVRDPVALAIIWEAYRTHKWPKRWSAITGILAAVLLGLCVVQMVAGDNPWFIALYGLRSYLLPLPVAFIMGENIDAEDLRKFGVCTLWLVMPLVALSAAQYYAGPASWLNAGAGKGAGQIGYSGGHVRASATFSFVTGPSNFMPLAAAFIFYGMVNSKFAKKWLLWGAAGAVILSVPIVGSRGMLVLLFEVLACVAVAAMFGISQLVGSMKVIGVLLVLFAIVSQLPVFSESMVTFEDRVSTAAESQGGSANEIDRRVGGPIIAAIESVASSAQWYGNGMGLGSNAASTLLTGTQQFLAGEGEMDRIIIEFGPPFGVAFILFRSLLALMIGAKAFSRVRDHQPLAWFLLPMVFNGLVWGIFEQPTSQGFMVVTLAFALAALNRPDIPAEPMQVLNPRLGQGHYGLRA
jgi:hypothetical protein